MCHNVCCCLTHQCKELIHVKMVIGEFLMGAPLRMVALEGGERELRGRRYRGVVGRGGVEVGEWGGGGKRGV